MKTDKIGENEYGLSYTTREKPSDIHFCEIIERLTIRKMKTIEEFKLKNKIIKEKWTAEYRKTLWKGERIFYIGWYLKVRKC